jgi:hypothetical protein
LVGKSDQKRSLKRPKKLGARVWTGFIWLRTAQQWALMNTVMNLQVP